MRRSIPGRYTVAVALAVAAGAALAITASGAPAPPAPGGSLEVGPGATLVDNKTGATYEFGLRADEDGDVAGAGSAVLGLGGGPMSLCTVHGPGAEVDFTNVGSEGGNEPYEGIECGRAFGQSVAVDGCVATIRAHGFVHSDHPLPSFIGGMTVDVRFHKTGPDTGNLSVAVATPAGTLAASGKASGPVEMSTCP